MMSAIILLRRVIGKVFHSTTNGYMTKILLLSTPTLKVKVPVLSKSGYCIAEFEQIVIFARYAI